MSNFLEFTDRNAQRYQHFDPLDEMRFREDERKADRLSQLDEFGYVKRPKIIPARTLTAQEQIQLNAENRVIIDSIHRCRTRARWQRGEEPLEEFLVRMGKTDVVVPVRCKTCGDPVKDNSEPCGKCQVERNEALNELHSNR